MAASRLIAGIAAVVAALVLQLGAQAPTATSSAATRPRLVVLIAVDQFRADYVDTYGAQWTGGLHELFTKGASFPNAAYPYLTTKTCAGHATIGTGALPSTHGMIDNEWYDVATHRFTTCTEDASARAIGFGGAAGVEHHSAKWLLVPNFADELKRQQRRPARVVSMSAKPRSAIGLGGHGGANTTIVWEEDANGVWATSSVLARDATPEARAYVKAHPIADWPTRVWDRLLPPSAYLFADQAPGEPADGVFPHSLEPPIRTSRTSSTYIDQWDKSPLVDAYLADFAAAMVERLKLGQRDATDMLAISFSGLDIVGHVYGPRSHEVQDTLARLDRLLGTLIGVLDRTVGREHFVLALSADHGVAMIPEQVEPATNAGRFTVLSVGAPIHRALVSEFGPGHYIEAMSGNDVYFMPGVLNRIRSSPAAIKAVEAAATGARGVARVLWASDLAATTPTDDPLIARARKSYKAGRSGDLTFVVKPNWMLAATGTTHGSPYDYDTHVPVAFMGAGVAPGRYPSAATPADVAPTLASMVGITLPHADGRPLREALKSQGH